MGLFGLFATAFGLSAMAKDAIDKSIYNDKARDRALITGEPFYYGVHGGRYFTETGKSCYLKTDYNTSQEWVVDTETEKKIFNYTEYLNKKATDENRRKAHAEGKRFYRTADFDAKPRYWCNVYVNDDMPGKYFYQSRCFEYGTYYVEADLIDGDAKYNGKYVRPRIPCVSYKEDGTRIEKRTRRI